MDEKSREHLISNMIDNLPTLRKKLNLSQENFSSLVGIGRRTFAAIENRKRPLSWNMFLSFLLVFITNPESEKLLKVMGIYSDELQDEMLKLRNRQ